MLVEGFCNVLLLRLPLFSTGECVELLLVVFTLMFMFNESVAGGFAMWPLETSIDLDDGLLLMLRRECVLGNDDEFVWLRAVL